MWGPGALGTPGTVSGDAQILFDVISLFESVFGILLLGRPLSEGLVCPDSADINDDGHLDVSDAVALLSYLLRGGAPPPSPFSRGGFDPTPDRLPECGD